MSAVRRPRTPCFDVVGESAVTDAICRAERGSRNEVHVSITARALMSGMFECVRRFLEPLEMHKIHDDEGVLLHVAVDDRKAPLDARKWVYGTCVQGRWCSVTDTAAREVREAHLSLGIIAALDLVGRMLRKAVSGENRCGNELADAIVRG